MRLRGNGDGGDLKKIILTQVEKLEIELWKHLICLNPIKYDNY